MTSKISFSKLTFDELKKLTWLTALQFLVFGLLITLRMVIGMARHTTEILKYGVEKDYLRIFCENAGLGHIENTIVILVIGILAAFGVFGYLYSSEKLDFWHSLPIRREALFTVKCLAGVLTFVIAYGLNQVLTTLIGIFYGGVNAAVLYEMLITVIQGILFFLCSFSGTLIAVMLTGKLLTSVFAVAVMAGYVPYLYFLGKILESVFFQAFLDSGEMYGSTWLYYTSPWTICMALENTGQLSGEILTGPYGPMPNAGDLCQLVAAATFCFLIALFLYRIRQTESAGRALAFEKTEGPVKLLLAVPLTLLAGVFAYELFERFSLVVLFILLAGLLCSMVMEFIYRWDIRQILAHKCHILITYVVSAAAFLFLLLDVFGFNTYLPEKDEIAAMAICDNNLRYGLTMNPELNFHERIKERLTVLETENFDRLYEAACNGVSNIEYRDLEQETMLVYLKYRLKNGKEVYRNYWISTPLLLEAMDSILMDETMKETYFDILTWNTEKLQDVEANCWIWTENETQQRNIWIDGKPLREVVTAYQKELRDIPYSDYFYSSGDMYFNDRDNYYTIGNYKIGEAFPETMKLLNQIKEEEQ